jgi:crotonobetainyl-CoA:carnitine CoA-transferase CaiB-like acyl-CoA transferase
VRRHDEIGDQAYCFPGFDLEDTPGEIVGPAPCLGADNDYVFRTLLGLEHGEIETLRDQGVFG